MLARRFAVAGFIALYLAAACCVAAAAAPWFADNFDSYNSGYLQGQGGWMNGSNDVRVQSTFVKAGKSVKMDYLAWGGPQSRVTM